MNGCILWFHKYDKWRVIDSGDVMTNGTRMMPLEEPQVKGKYIIQQRSCMTCGKSQINKQEVNT
jgi:hypothetical protein